MEFFASGQWRLYIEEEICLRPLKTFDMQFKKFSQCYILIVFNFLSVLKVLLYRFFPVRPLFETHIARWFLILGHSTLIQIGLQLYAPIHLDLLTLRRLGRDLPLFFLPC